MVLNKYLLHNLILYFAVFWVGMATMVFELVCSRLLAPYLGMTLLVWTSLIGVILACIGFGNWIGGRIADKKPRFNNLSWIVYFSGLSMVITVITYKQILIFAQRANNIYVMTLAIICITQFFFGHDYALYRQIIFKKTILLGFKGRYFIRSFFVWKHIRHFFSGIFFDSIFWKQTSADNVKHDFNYFGHRYPCNTNKKR